MGRDIQGSMLNFWLLGYGMTQASLVISESENLISAGWPHDNHMVVPPGHRQLWGSGWDRVLKAALDLVCFEM
jgi:hypothetical protein